MASAVVLRLQPSAPTGFVVAAAAVHILAIAVAITGTFVYKAYMSPYNPLLVWNTFALHPLLMTIAFALLAPLSAVSWRVYHLHLGMGVRCVCFVHLLLSSAALACGAAGIYDMWLVHADKIHFQSAHSWVGAVVFIAFAYQWLQVVFARELFGTATHDASARSFLSTLVMFGGLFGVTTGILSHAGRGDNHDMKDVAFKWLSMLILLLCFALGTLLGMPPPDGVTSYIYTPNNIIISSPKWEAEGSVQASEASTVPTPTSLPAPIRTTHDAATEAARQKMKVKSLGSPQLSATR
jgi:hypothetical protein